jgi:tRNA-2-methylthio-N6-dimethylallyladenosine synthase
LAVTTDIIVGFPGETEADFERTLDVVDAAAFDAAYTFVFSPRPGTPAATLDDEMLPTEVTQERMRRLTDVVERHALERHQARVGRTEEILVDGLSKRDASRVSGRTRQGKLVHVPAGDGLDPGRYARVRVTDAAPHWLTGAPLVQIPVVAG